MPCPLCESTYLNKPCESDILIITDSLCEIFNKKFTTGLFNALREACPCTECLVKVVCFTHRLECPDYIIFLRYNEEVKHSSEVSMREDVERWGNAMRSLRSRIH